MSEATGDVPAAGGSALSSLRARRDKAREAQTYDLVVPGMEPLFVRFRALPFQWIDDARSRMDKSKDPDRVMVMNAALLARACVGIFDTVGGNPVSVDPDDIDGEPVTFGPRLAELLGVPEITRAGDLVRALYPNDAIVLATAGELTEKSGYTVTEIETANAKN